MSDKFNFELKVYGSLCATSVFKINGIDASSSDFGDQEDQNREEAEDYACGNMKFTRSIPTQKVLEKYNITKEQFNLIADELEQKLSFGRCGWCV